LAIGIGRVVLNVHYPSDVLAGWALGYAYFVAWRADRSARRGASTVTDKATGSAR